MERIEDNVSGGANPPPRLRRVTMMHRPSNRGQGEDPKEEHVTEIHARSVALRFTPIGSHVKCMSVFKELLSGGLYGISESFQINAHFTVQTTVLMNLPLFYLLKLYRNGCTICGHQHA